MDLGNGLGHLTYSTLVHPGDTWDALWESLTTYLPRVKGADLAERAVWGLAAAICKDRADAGGRPVRPRSPQGLFRRQRPLRLHGQRVPVRCVQGHARQGAGLRTRLAFRGVDGVHDQCRRRARRHRSPRDGAVHSNRAAWFQAARHGAGRGRQLYGARPEGGRASGCARSANWPHRDPGARAGAVLLPRDHRGDGALLPRPPVFGRVGPAPGEIGWDCRL